MHIGSEIRRAREASGWSQAKLAGGAERGVPGVGGSESGARHPSVVTRSQVADALGIAVVDLFPRPQTPQPSLEDAALSEALQAALAVLFQGLARRGQGIVEQSLREGPSEALS